MKINKKLQFNAVIKKKGNVITVIASDETLDRHGEVLKIADWDLTQFRKAPRMLVDHDHSVEKIVGKWLNARIEDGQLLLDADFHDITQLSKEVHKMVKEDYLNSVSVGAIYNPPDKDGSRGKLELIETSWVTVGANPSALVKIKELGEATDDEKEKIEDFLNVDIKINDDETVDKPVESEEKIATLTAEKQELEKQIVELKALCEKQVTLLTSQSQKIKAFKKGVFADSVLKAISQQVNRALQVRNEQKKLLD